MKGKVMSRKIVIFMVWLGVVLCFAGGSTAWAWIPPDSDCLDCHIDQEGTLKPEFQGETGCITCHSSATTATYYTLNPEDFVEGEPGVWSWRTPEIKVPVTVYTGSTEPTEFLASGNFWWVKGPADGIEGSPYNWTGGGDDAGGHNIFPNENDERYEVQAGTDPVSWLSTAPGHSSGCLSEDSCHSNLNKTNNLYGSRQSCLKCHMMVTGPDYTGFHHANDTASLVGFQKGVPGTPGFDGFYRFLTGHMSGQGHGVAGIEDEYWEANVKSNYLEHNEYLGFQSSLNTPGGFSSEGHTSTGYCSGCHGNFHVASRHADGIVDCPPGSEPDEVCYEWKGHPVGMVLPDDGDPEVDSEFDHYKIYNPNVPLGRPDLENPRPDPNYPTGYVTYPSGKVHPGFDAINCLSCHRSHGTPGGSHLRWDPTDWDGCAQCHKTKKKWNQDYYLCDEIDDCNDCHTSHGKSLRYPDDEFGPTENDMLVWMRVEVKSSPIQITAPASPNDTYVQVAPGDIAVFGVGETIEIRDTTNSQQLTITSVDAVAYRYHFAGDPLLSSYAVGSNLYHVDLRNCTFPIPGDSPYVRDDTPPGEGYDGICELCHTETLYWKNDGSGAPHYGGPGAGEQCLDCHEHTSEFLGEMPDDAAHNIHTQDLPRGPDPMQCEECHQHGETVAEMADEGGCDSCHSEGGAFNGVDNPVIGVKYNWPDWEVSLDSLIYETDGTALRSGKEQWCAGCHDDDDGSSMISGVTAPNVMGDNLSYGFNISGHGRPSAGKNCGDCHDFTRLHVDSQARTYVAASHNYRNGYRLNEDMAVPRNGEIDPQAFRLCTNTNCHAYSAITGPTTSNFRDDQKGQQYHAFHLNTWPAGRASDSDFDGIGCSTGICVDSAITCVNCHNVHGSPTAAMIRHGELISTPGTNDKVPALSFSWYKADGSTPATTVEESRYGTMECGNWPDVSVNHVCAGCHLPGRLYYKRTPTQIQSICECGLVPDATVINRGGTLGFQVSVTNNTGGMGSVLFGTKVTKPDASQTGFIWGPLQVYLNPYQTKSGHKTHTIPGGFELGMYTYHGYVGRYGNIYDECQFDFEVVP